MARRLGGLPDDAPPVGEPVTTLHWLAGRLGNRRSRLFACACCRAALEFQTEERWYDVLESLEQKVERMALGSRLDPRRPSRRVARSNVAGAWALEALWNLGQWFERGAPVPLRDWTNHFWPVIDHAARALREAAGESNWDNARGLLDHLLRDIAEPVLRPHRVAEAGWLRWQDGTIRRMAQAIYEDNRFEDLPILADALEDAGCTAPEMLTHCRGPGPHARGCWVVDLLLGRT